jgi:hypothetical protein
MTHAVRNCIRTTRLAIVPAGMVFCLLLLFPLAATSQTSTFTEYSSPSNGSGILHGDLNGDGYEDLITNASSTFNVYLSNGNGTYRPSVNYKLPSGYSLVSLGDFNNDGKLDLITQNGSSISVYLGNGDGTFRAPVNHAVNGTAEAVADVNHDGKQDLLIYTAGGDILTDMQVLFGNGDGSFHAGPVAYDVPNGTLYTGDFNGDGNVDVASIDAQPAGTQFEILTGDGKGNFTVTYSDSNGDDLTLIVADVNGDKISDLIGTGTSLFEHQAIFTETNLFVYYGQSDGSMAYARIPLANFTTFGVGQVAVADFNGDGVPDIAYLETDCDEDCFYPTTPATINVLSGEGNGNFALETPVTGLEANPGPLFAVRGNRDTKADLAFTNLSASGSPIFTTLLNTTTGNFPTCAAPNAAVGIAQCSPVSGSTVTSPVNFAIGAAAAEPIRKVELWADGKKQLEQFADAFSNYGFLNASVPLAAGTHRINIITSGWDNSQISKVSTIDVKASSSCSAPASAGVHICSPANGSTASSPVLVEATAKVTGTIVSTQLWVDGVKNFNAAASDTLTTSVSLVAGSHRFAVIASNTSGQKWESAVTATVK